MSDTAYPKIRLIHSLAYPVLNLYCTRSNFVQNATVDLRVLRGGVPRPGIRLIGRVERRRGHNEIVAGAKVVIDGPQGTIVTETDREGVYDVLGAPPGHYAIRADVYSKARREYPSSPDYE